MRAVLLLAVFSALAGCSRPPPEVVFVTPEPDKPAIATECEEADKPWIELPDDATRRGTGTRNYSANKDQYRVLLAKREICRANLKALYDAHATTE